MSRKDMQGKLRAKWRVHRTSEVAAYLVGLREASKGARQVIEMLSIYGVPANAQMEEGYFYWEAAGFWFVAAVAEEEKAIAVVEVHFVG